MTLCDSLNCPLYSVFNFQSSTDINGVPFIKNDKSSLSKMEIISRGIT
jgi:hypothetical protein